MIPELVRIRRVVREIDEVFTWHLDMSTRPDGFVFQPGQFNMLYVIGVGEVPISISGDPAQPKTLVHTVRAVGSVTAAMKSLAKDTHVGVRGPFGSPWPLDTARGKDLLFVGGGLGLAPLRPAILDVLARRLDYGRVTVLYGARSPELILYRSDLERWRGRLDTTVDVTVDCAPAGGSWRGNVDVVTRLVATAELDPEETVALVCGPEVMMRFAVRELTRRGVPPTQIYLSMERNMKCGVGLCGHCQYGPTFMCKDGPVYRYAELARWFYLRDL